jgi:HAD superfamily hydrolase (TIGR01484 family)
VEAIERLRIDEAVRLRGLLFDLDDTFLAHGVLTESAYGALHRLAEAGLALLVVTGRPAGWGELIARQWPVAGVVTENGAIGVFREGRTVERLDTASADDRQRRRARVTALVNELRAELPELVPADDVAARISDFTFDIGEGQRAPRELVERAAELARSRGARVTRSSVHLHVSYDRDDKASGAVRLLRRLYAVDPTIARATFAFIGDSENDEACFAAFHTTIGVSNLSGRPSVPPRFVTRAARSAGFTEAAQALLRLRGVLDRRRAVL